ncbi:MAG: hypothetical protein LBT99_01650 [Bifidobacteriaceae bacterium]|nr:hypothetical protein [Bifidobacteriaceae bacterium]
MGINININGNASIKIITGIIINIIADVMLYFAAKFSIMGTFSYGNSEKTIGGVLLFSNSHIL